MPIVLEGWRWTEGTEAFPGYSVFIVPWAGVKAVSGDTFTRTQQSGSLGGGVFYPTSNTQSSTIEWDIWLDAGTYKVTAIFEANTNKAILRHRLNGVSVGTSDMYAGAQAMNTYAEVTAIAVTAGLKTYSLINDTKNVSSTGYGMFLQSLAWIRTGA